MGRDGLTVRPRSGPWASQGYIEAVNRPNGAHRRGPDPRRSQTNMAKKAVKKAKKTKH